MKLCKEVIYITSNKEEGTCMLSVIVRSAVNMYILGKIVYEHSEFTTDWSQFLYHDLYEKYADADPSVYEIQYKFSYAEEYKAMRLDIHTPGIMQKDILEYIENKEVDVQ
jgi:hypothetical protein